MATIKVKVAVAVDLKGHWCAAGWQEASDEDKRAGAAEHVESGERIYWLNAELEVPESVEVEVQATVGGEHNQA